MGETKARGEYNERVNERMGTGLGVRARVLGAGVVGARELENQQTGEVVRREADKTCGVTGEEAERKL